MNYLPEFFALLRQAAADAEAVDQYDVNSSDPVSAEQFRTLCAAQTLSCNELIGYVREHDFVVPEEESTQ